MSKYSTKTRPAKLDLQTRQPETDTIAPRRIFSNSTKHNTHEDMKDIKKEVFHKGEKIAEDPADLFTKMMGGK